MSFRKSFRLAAKGFKTKPSQGTISLEEGSTDSEETLETLTKIGTRRECRSKEKQDQENQEKDKDMFKAKEKSKSEEPLASSDSNSESSPDSTPLSPQPKRKRKIGFRSIKTDPIAKKRKTLHSKVLECAFIDFKFFKENGFYWKFWLDRIGCRNLCNLSDVFDGWVIQDFYDHLEILEDSSLKSKVSGKIVKISRKDMIECFDMLDEEDDSKLVEMEKQALYRELNDGIGQFFEKDIFATDFDLVIRLLHKIVVDCILPKNGSTTTISMEEAVVVVAMKKNIKLDMPTMILRHLWRTKNNRPYGNLLMKLFKFKKISLPKDIKVPIGLKKIGETNLKKMGIQVSEKFWFSKDGSWYRNPKFSKFSFDWKRIKALAEGEFTISEGTAETTVGEEKKKEKDLRKKGKEKMHERVKKKHQIRTGGKFEIKEGRNISESDSESESEPFIPHSTYGETSISSLKTHIEQIVDQHLNATKKSLIESILYSLKDVFFADHTSSPPSPVHPTSSHPPPSPAKDKSPTKTKSPARDSEQAKDDDPQKNKEQPVADLSLVPTQAEPTSAPQPLDVEVTSTALILFQQSNPNPQQLHTSFRQRRKMKAHKIGSSLEYKKDN